jgi:hypothetical protein
VRALQYDIINGCVCVCITALRRDINHKLSITILQYQAVIIIITMNTLCINLQQYQYNVARIPRSSGAGGVGSIPANPDAQNVPSFRRWRFEMKLSPFI